MTRPLRATAWLDGHVCLCNYLTHAIGIALSSCIAFTLTKIVCPVPVPAGIQPYSNVVLTSMRRYDVASTLVERCFDDICLLGCIFFTNAK